uniref:Uncharacterized protein n=1 Tax=Trypanosoma vivax (strain Y486) TaxID=1055687 RepID=G0U9V2_TRYVY|nr:conserved hypothetical protein, fragment [Trypanosoma vivax Y486]
MGQSLCVPHRGGGRPMPYFGVPIAQLIECERQVVQQSPNYIPGIPLLMQDMMFYCESNSEASVGSAPTTSPDDAWVEAAEKKINEFVVMQKLIRVQVKARVLRNPKRPSKIHRSEKRFFEEPLQAMGGGAPPGPRHLIVLLTAFLKRLPEPLLPASVTERLKTVTESKGMDGQESAREVKKILSHGFALVSPKESACFRFVLKLVRHRCADVGVAEIDELARAIVRVPIDTVIEHLKELMRSDVVITVSPQKQGEDGAGELPPEETSDTVPPRSLSHTVGGAPVLPEQQSADAAAVGTSGEKSLGSEEVASFKMLAETERGRANEENPSMSGNAGDTSVLLPSPPSCSLRGDHDDKMGQPTRIAPIESELSKGSAEPSPRTKVEDKVVGPSSIDGPPALPRPCLTSRENRSDAETQDKVKNVSPSECDNKQLETVALDSCELGHGKKRRSHYRDSRPHEQLNIVEPSNRPKSPMEAPEWPPIGKSELPSNVVRTSVGTNGMSEGENVDPAELDCLQRAGSDAAGLSEEAEAFYEPLHCKNSRFNPGVAPMSPVHGDTAVRPRSTVGRDDISTIPFSEAMRSGTLGALGAFSTHYARHAELLRAKRVFLGREEETAVCYAQPRNESPPPTPVGRTDNFRYNGADGAIGEQKYAGCGQDKRFEFEAGYDRSAAHLHLRDAHDERRAGVGMREEQAGHYLPLMSIDPLLVEVQYLSHKIHDLAIKTEQREKENLDLRIELTAAQRQALTMREKLFATS